MARGSPLPDLELALTRPFFQAAARGELAIQRCGRCARFIWYPRERCPVCGDTPSWSPVSGHGTLFSFTVVRRALWAPFADRVPYVPALVALREDPEVRIVSDLVDCDPGALRVDMPVRAVFRPLRFAGFEGEVVVPLFAPV